MTTPTPQTLLIDGDMLFAYGFKVLAKRYHVPVRWLDSVIDSHDGKIGDCDLVLLDWDSCGGEFVFDVASEIRESNPAVPIVVIGYQDPPKSEMRRWTGIIQGFVNKGLGVDSVLIDAMKMYRTALSGEEQALATIL